MNDKNRNLLVRIGSAVVLLPVVVGLLMAGIGTTAGLMAFVAGAVAYEYYDMALAKGSDHIRWLGVAVSAALPVVFLYLHTPVTFAQVALGGMALLVSVFAYFLLVGPLESAPQKAALVFFGVGYVGLGVGSLAALRGESDGLKWVVLSVILTFGNDAGAYFAGRFLGKRKLYVAVSPNKTWEGFWGGMASAVLLAFIVSQTMMPQLTPLDALGLGIPCSILGPIGDLCESMLKRAYNVKDSGKIIPGHGGLLDRIDALMFNAPYVLFYAMARFHGP